MRSESSARARNPKLSNYRKAERWLVFWCKRGCLHSLNPETDELWELDDWKRLEEDPYVIDQVLQELPPTNKQPHTLAGIKQER